MRSVLILGPDFSPSSYPPAIRIRLLGNHLPEFGWKPTVIATHYQHYETPYDLENEKLLSPEMEVVRTSAVPAAWTRRLRFGDLGWRSLWHHWRAVERQIQVRRPDLMFLPTPPSAQLLLGPLARKQFGIPYVIDCIDPIVTDYYWRLPRAQRPPKWWLSYRVGAFLEAAVLRSASAITAVDAAYLDEAKERYSWMRRRRVSSIPYGGETDDFVYVRAHPRPNRVFDASDGNIHISYVGVVGPYMKATLSAVFEAFRAGLARAPEAFERVRLHFVGTSYAPSGEPQVLPLAGDLASKISEHPARVSYLDAIQLLLDSHMLLVLGSEEAHYTASKVFPVIMANRPILAVLHRSSSAADILRSTGAAAPITFSRASEIPTLKENIFCHWAGMLGAPPAFMDWAARKQAFAPYTARAMAGRLAAVFEEVLAA